MDKSIVLRMNLSDFKSIQTSFPPYPKESAVNYFERLAENLKLLYLVKVIPDSKLLQGGK